jgi:hypothetical protein
MVEVCVSGEEKGVAAAAKVIQQMCAVTSLLIRDDTAKNLFRHVHTLGRQHNVKIHVDPAADSDGMRKVEITGEDSSIKAAAQEISGICTPSVSVTVQIPGPCKSMLLGPAGSKVKQLQADHSVEIRVKDEVDGMRMVDITGQESGVTNAAEVIRSTYTCKDCEFSDISLSFFSKDKVWRCEQDHSVKIRVFPCQSGSTFRKVQIFGAEASLVAAAAAIEKECASVCSKTIVVPGFAMAELGKNHKYLERKHWVRIAYDPYVEAEQQELCISGEESAVVATTAEVESFVGEITARRQKSQSNVPPPPPPPPPPRQAEPEPTECGDDETQLDVIIRHGADWEPGADPEVQSLPADMDQESRHPAEVADQDISMDLEVQRLLSPTGTGNIVRELPYAGAQAKSKARRRSRSGHHASAHPKSLAERRGCSRSRSRSRSRRDRNRYTCEERGWCDRDGRHRERQHDDRGNQGEHRSERLDRRHQHEWTDRPRADGKYSDRRENRGWDHSRKGGNFEPWARRR